RATARCLADRPGPRATRGECRLDGSDSRHRGQRRGPHGGDPQSIGPVAAREHAAAAIAAPYRVALTMLVPNDTVLAGQQVDLIAAAWIPRELGERVRRPPLLTLVPPE